MPSFESFLFCDSFEHSIKMFIIYKLIQSISLSERRGFSFGMFPWASQYVIRDSDIDCSVFFIGHHIHTRIDTKWSIVVHNEVFDCGPWNKFRVTEFYVFLRVLPSVLSWSTLPILCLDLPSFLLIPLEYKILHWRLLHYLGQFWNLSW